MHRHLLFFLFDIQKRLDYHEKLRNEDRLNYNNNIVFNKSWTRRIEKKVEKFEELAISNTTIHNIENKVEKFEKLAKLKVNYYDICLKQIKEYLKK